MSHTLQLRHPNSSFMNVAIAHAEKAKSKGLPGIAAIVVLNDQVIAVGLTTTRKNVDPTCHAEINAIKSAASYLNTKNLSGCYLYSTFEPCPMCSSAAVWAKMNGIVFGAYMSDQTKTHKQRVNISCEYVLANSTPNLSLAKGFMREKCLPLLQ